MPRPFTYLPLLCLVVMSCNGIASSINNTVEQTLATAKDSLRQEESRARDAYTATYRASLPQVSDQDGKKKLVKLDSTITAGVKYMDSISGEMSSISLQDPRNMDYLKNRFLYEGIGDTLFVILTRVNDLGQSVAQQTGHVATVDSLRLTILNPPTEDAWEKRYFSVLNPIAAMALLHYFIDEIYQVGQACLSSR